MNPPPADLPAIDPAVVRRVAPDADLVSIFCERAAAVGLQVSRSSPTAVVSDVATLIRGILPQDSSGHPGVIIEPALPLHDQLAELLNPDVHLLDPHAGDDAMFTAHIGVTGVWSAVAETGSLVCTSGPDMWRGLSLIPPVHVAIVHAQQIVPDLVDLFTTGMPAKLPASVTIISGPSKTADIEGILITGVHGPGVVHVVVVDDAG